MQRSPMERSPLESSALDPSAFRDSTGMAEPPPGLSAPLQTLWWEAKGDWKRAHECAQEDKTSDGALVHAYLHRVEGDLSNARYWYNRAGKEPAAGTTAEEWNALVRAFL